MLPTLNKRSIHLRQVFISDREVVKLHSCAYSCSSDSRISFAVHFPGKIFTSLSSCKNVKRFT